MRLRPLSLARQRQRVRLLAPALSKRLPSLGARSVWSRLELRAEPAGAQPFSPFLLLWRPTLCTASSRLSCRPTRRRLRPPHSGPGPGAGKGAGAGTGEMSRHRRVFFRTATHVCIIRLPLPTATRRSTIWRSGFRDCRAVLASRGHSDGRCSGACRRLFTANVAQRRSVCAGGWIGGKVNLLSLNSPRRSGESGASREVRQPNALVLSVQARLMGNEQLLNLLRGAQYHRLHLALAFKRAHF